MRNLWTIAKREFQHYFVSPVAYAVTFAFLLVLGLIFYDGFVRTALQPGTPPQPVQWVFGPFTTLLLFLTPAVTMRLISEEQKTGTMELLLTAPLREWELVVGKWLAAFAFMAVIVFTTVIYMLITNQYSQPRLNVVEILVTYIGALAMIGALLAIGVFASALFSNQIAAFFVTMAVALGLWLTGLPFQNDTGPMAQVMNYLGFSSHFYDNLFRGVLDGADLIYFVSLIVFFLFIAARMIESRRWR
jgi:ABC-2 type transport system permease protein